MELKNLLKMYRDSSVLKDGNVPSVIPAKENVLNTETSLSSELSKEKETGEIKINANSEEWMDEI